MERFDQDRARILELHKTGKIDWVALEMLPDEFQMSHLGQWEDGVDSLWMDLQAKGVSKELYDRTISYGFGPIIDDYLYGNQSSWDKNIQMVGFDSSFIKSWDASFEEANYIGRILMNSPNLEPKHIRAISEFAGKISPQNIPSLDEIQKFVQIMPTAEREKISIYFHKLKTANEIGNMRDVYAAQNLLTKKGNGFLVMGDAHKINLVAQLTEQCQEGHGTVRNSAPTPDAVE